MKTYVLAAAVAAALVLFGGTASAGDCHAPRVVQKFQVQKVQKVVKEVKEVVEVKEFREVKRVERFVAAPTVAVIAAPIFITPGPPTVEIREFISPPAPIVIVR